MTYEELILEVKDNYKDKIVENMNGEVSLQVNIFGSTQGIFYLRIIDGIIEIFPFQYQDYDAIISASYEEFMKIVKGELTIEEAYNEKRIIVDGDISAVIWLNYVKKINEYNN